MRRTWKWIPGVVMALVVLVALQGCAAVGLGGASAGFAALQGTGTLVRVGTEYKSNGIVQRTFTAPADPVYAAVLDTLKRLDVTLREEELTDKGRRIIAQAQDRTLDIRVEPVTTALTQVRFSVKSGVLRRDAATASEIVSNVEHELARTASLAQRAKRR